MKFIDDLYKKEGEQRYHSKNYYTISEDPFVLKDKFPGGVYYVLNDEIMVYEAIVTVRDKEEINLIEIELIFYPERVFYFVDTIGFSKKEYFPNHFFDLSPDFDFKIDKVRVIAQLHDNYLLGLMLDNGIELEVLIKDYMFLRRQYVYEQDFNE